MNTPQHYFASTCYFWVTDATLQGAINKMRGQYVSESHKTKQIATVLIFLVPTEESALYEISWYCPQVEGATQVACERLFPELPELKD